MTKPISQAEFSRRQGTRKVYVCSNNCGIAYHHSLNYCPRCPGKLIPREIPWDYKLWPEGHFTKDGTENYSKWLKENGLELAGENK